MKTVVLGVCGSIAAYKAADLTSKLVKREYSVFVVLTENATQFVGPMTFQTLSKNPVTSGVFDERESWRAAFALTVSLVWIYTNLLRILAFFQSD